MDELQTLKTLAAILKDLTFAVLAAYALRASAKRVWGWYYQFDEQIKEVRDSAEREMKLMRDALSKAEQREQELRQLVYERREILSQALNLATGSKT